MLGGYYLGQLYLGISGLPGGGETILSVQPSSHQLSSDNINLTQKHILVVNPASHTLTSENITLTQKHVLSVEDAIHSLMSENVALTSEHFLGVNDAFHSVTSTEIQLTQKHTIVVDNTTHSVNSDNLELTEHKTLAVNDTLHGHTVESVTISVRSYLDVADTLHNHTVDGLTLTQKHTLSVEDTLHDLISDTLGGLINLQPYGFGGGFGSIDGWGVKQFGEINIELPLNFILIADNAMHTVSFDDLDEFIQIFNSIKTGIYIKNFGDDGAVGSEYAPGVGTVPSKHSNIGQIIPVAELNRGILTPNVGKYGSYIENDINSGIVNTGNSGNGILTPEVEDTGNYTKSNNKSGEYEVI